MGLFSSGASSIRSAQAQAAGQLAAGEQKAASALNQYADKATSELNATKGQVGDIYKSGLGYLNSGFNSALGTLGGLTDQANAQLSPYNAVGTQANEMYANAMGLNGNAGIAKASQSFRSTPGYQAMLDEANKAVMRNASASGSLGSGATARALQEASANVADKTYQDWMGNINTGADRGLTAANAMGQNTSNIGQTLANTQAAQGQALAGLGTDYGNQLTGLSGSIADTYSTLGSNLGSLYQNTATQLSQNTISAANAIAQAKANSGLSSLAGGAALLGAVF